MTASGILNFVAALHLIPDAHGHVIRVCGMNQVMQNSFKKTPFCRLIKQHTIEYRKRYGLQELIKPQEIVIESIFQIKMC